MDMPKNGAPKLILPEWDPLPTKHLHASLDMISLLHLDGLYSTYVRPYFDPVPETDDEGPPPSLKRKTNKKQGLSKGYVGLLEDCIDPVPMGNQAEHSLLPLVGEWLDPQRPPWVPDESAQGPLTILSRDAFSSARLEAGLKVDGYAGGEKIGVKEAEERRKRKKARMSQSVAPDLPDLAASPAASVLNPPPPKARTPFSIPRKPGQKPWPRSSAPPGQGGFRPGTRGTPTPRPMGPGGRTPGTPTGLKRPGESAYPANAKRRALGGGSRSASPMGASSSSGLGDDVGVKAVFKR